MERILNRAQCAEIATRIINRFHRRCAGDPYGIDWPTMRITFPREGAVLERLKTRFYSLGRETSQFETMSEVLGE